MVELGVPGLPTARLYGVPNYLPDNVYAITYRPEYRSCNPNEKAVEGVCVDPDIGAWFRAQELTPEAQKWLGYKSCCSHADRFQTKFKVDKSSGKDEWWYCSIPNGACTLPEQWLKIPDYVIHNEGIHALKAAPGKPQADDSKFAQLRAEGVLFMVSGKVACFWPPESGI